MSNRATAAIWIAVVLVVGSASAQGQQVQVSRGLSFSLIREHGRGRFPQCRLTITFNPQSMNVNAKPPVASIECGAANRPELTATEELTVDEARRLAAVFENPAFWTGEIAGTDQRRRDGIFERLEIRAGDIFAVVVTSGNPSFAQAGARLDFMSVVRPLEGRLMQRAEGKRP
jgi:hypothetical protein